MRSIFISLLAISLLTLLLTGCSNVAEDNKVFIGIIDGGTSFSIEISSGTSVEQILTAEQISLGPLDRVEPPPSTLMIGGETIHVIRVREEFSIVESILPFEQQTIKNESLPEGQSVLIHSGGLFLS